jgi:hypothetical protein
MEHQLRLAGVDERLPSWSSLAAALSSVNALGSRCTSGRTTRARALHYMAGLTHAELASVSASPHPDHISNITVLLRHSGAANVFALLRVA